MLEEINLRQSIRSLANEARAHRASEDSAAKVLDKPMANTMSFPKSPEEKREESLKLKEQVEIQKVLSGFFGEKKEEKKVPFFLDVPEKRGVGRPKKLDCEKVKRIGMKLPPELLKFLSELKIEGGRGFGSKMRAIIEEWNVLKKREGAQLQTLKKNLDRLESVIRSFSNSEKTSLHLGTNEELVKRLKAYCESVVQLTNLYSFDDAFLKKRLVAGDYRNYAFAVHYLSNSRERVH